ncbi:MAG: LamG-like jellyroll fold domain-containing protein [Nanoarchaeota archaeon]
MIRKKYGQEREKGFGIWRFILILSLLLMASVALLTVRQNELNTYEIIPLNFNSSVKFLLTSHNDNLGDVNMQVLAVDEEHVGDLQIEINKDSIGNATFNRVNISSHFELMIDTEIIGLKVKGYDTAKAFAIDPTKIEFENATFTIKATGKQLFKCVEWNFSEQKCYGKWTKIRNVIPGQDYELLITKQDPAFIETNQSDFDLGIYNRTFFNTTIGAVQINYSYNNGTYLSRIFDAESLANWTNISWVEGAPYSEELPDSQKVEDALGGANMTGNVLLLHLNDGNGASVFADTSGNINNGTCSGADCPTWTATGKFGGAYSFDSNDRIGTQITTQFNDFSVEVWFKDNGDNLQYERLVDKSYTQCFWLGRNSNTPNSWGGGVRETSSPYGIFVNLQDGEWHQIVSIRKGTTHYVYGDGGRVIASNTVSGTACDTTTLAVGAWGAVGSTQQRLTGIIDEVSFYNRSLSAEEVLDHYKRGMLRLNLTVRSCDDSNCDADTWNETFENSSTQSLIVANNQHFQYKADFFTYDPAVLPELYNVTIGYDILDDIAPIIYLESPTNETINTTDKTPDFKFNATDETASTLNCSLWLNATTGGTAEIKATNSSVNNMTSTILTPATSLSNDLYWWWIGCSDGFNSNISEKRIINMSVGDLEAPTIQLVSPEDGMVNTTDNSPDFTFIPSDDIADTLNCTLWLNETLSGTPKAYGYDPSVVNGSTATITANSSLINQNYSWWINCSDGTNTNVSVKRLLVIYVDVNPPVVSLTSPAQNSNDIDFSAVNFTCSASDDIYLKNMSLYSDYNGGWQFIDNNSLSGTTDSVTFVKNILQNNQFVSNYFKWNCLAYDNTSKSNWSALNYTFSDWDLGTHDNTIFNTTEKAITLHTYGSDGIYASQIFDAGSAVGWKNMSWYSNAINAESELAYFNNSESKNYYSQVTYSVRHWYNVPELISEFSQLKVSAVLDCDGSCSGPTYIRIGNSTNWTDYEFLNAALVRTDATTSDYTWYNNTYNISKGNVGDYFFVQLLLFTGTGTIKFLMDESGPAGPDPEYRPGSNGDGGQSGWTDDNGDYAINVYFIQNTDVNLTVRSCNDTSCNGESWSEPLSNSTFSELPVPNNQYFQYAAHMESAGSSVTPKLYNVTINYGSADDVEPAISIFSPVNRSGNNGNVTSFTYSVADESSIDNCELIMEGVVQDTDYSISKGITQEFNISEMALGTYDWHINCTDMNDNENSSEIREVTIVPSYEFTGRTTDFSQVDIENITNLILEKPSFGLINYSETINLSGGGNINSFVIIAYNLISIDTGNLPQLNKSAEVTSYNLSFAKPIILKDNEPCTTCNIIIYADNLTFSVPSFSAYSASENSQLELWDDTDSSMKYANNVINFFANYTNRTSKESINGPSIYCNVSFSDIGTNAMVFNSSTELYWFNRTFSSAGIYFYNITCTDTTDNYASLNATDYASINDMFGPQSPDNITVIRSERANVSRPPGGIETQAGNLTQFIVNASIVTKSWQGYFGRVNELIYLRDSSDLNLYEWSILQPSGEIYATRALDVNFADINCSTAQEITSEEAFIGQESANGDSVRNTFNKDSHPQFGVGSVTIEANSCNATNLYVNSSAQDAVFYEVLLSDGASNMVYITLLDANQTGFDNQNYDFEMLVGENGDEEATTAYYFFVEIS